MFFLAGLGSKYDAFVSSATTRADPLSFEQLFAHLLTYEACLQQQHTSTQLTVELTASVTTKNPPSPRDGRYSPRGSRGRGRGGCNTSFSHSQGSYSEDPKPTCQVCGKTGHTTLSCYNRFNLSFLEQSSPSHTTSPVSYYTSPSSSSDLAWYLDTASTNHVTSDLA